MNLVLVLGNQLFDPQIIKKNLGRTEKASIFMREDQELCTYFKFHKQKIIFFLSAMRSFSLELKKFKFDVHYENLKPQKKINSFQDSYEVSLQAFIKKNKIKKVFLFEIEDKFFESRLLKMLSENNIDYEIWQSPMFLTSRLQFQDYLKNHKRPFMKIFYQEQRKRLQVLVDEKSEPIGGRWSFDEENRKYLPSTISPPALPQISQTSVVTEVTEICEKMFPDHPGLSEPFWLPVDRVGAVDWLNQFVDERLAQFGPYEDAIPAHSDFVFHSVLTPFLNVGLLTPDFVVAVVLKRAKQKKIDMASTEGFVRQIIGWREFVRGIYQNFSVTQDNSNFWKHTKKLSPVWYQGGTGIPPLDRALKKVVKYGYLHHIERLMVVGSLMLLLEVEPKEAHRWFMEMFIDSSDWVMGPNVYGMALFSDGGIFATKPYICGSNYYIKMGKDAKGDWCDGVDGLYWEFIEKHQTFFMKNPRLSMMARAVQKIKPERMKILRSAAKKLREKLTVKD